MKNIGRNPIVDCERNGERKEEYRKEQIRIENDRRQQKRIERNRKLQKGIEKNRI